MRRERGTTWLSVTSLSRERIERIVTNIRPSPTTRFPTRPLTDLSDVVLVLLLSLVVVVLSRSRFLSKSNSSCAQQIRGFKSLA
ncbi:hypothetical protein FA13DRAFT_199971 [Coprinellus micaceus]|uniref:Uncharacterized protein n=1 Tax=Coprinellus micaceus TaxID=71717 RepID=A0A4Y7SGX4_COPMI|nr:hypothetical protein FA13DRAFT_199971 [Coprinellus micaceus]